MYVEDYGRDWPLILLFFFYLSFLFFLFFLLLFFFFALLRLTPCLNELLETWTVSIINCVQFKKFTMVGCQCG